jgi:TetR/AcrR family acrAB operon transcriptional repressor
MAKRTKEDANLTRTGILDAAERIFCAKGVGTATLAEIASEAGVTRGAIYWHFRNKDALLTAVCDRSNSAMKAVAATGMVLENDDPLGYLHDYLCRLLCFLARNPHRRTMFEMIFNGHIGMQGRRGAPGLNMRRSVFDLSGMIRICIQQAVRKGQLISHYDVAFGQAAVKALLAGMLAEWLRRPVVNSLELDAKRIAGLAVKVLSIC